MEKKFNTVYDLVIEEYFKSTKIPSKKLYLELKPNLVLKDIKEASAVVLTKLKITAFEEESKEICFEFLCEMQSECNFQGIESEELKDCAVDVGIQHYAIIRSRLRSLSLMTSSPVLNIPIINTTQLKKVLTVEA